jgi:hypothetical protein
MAAELKYRCQPLTPAANYGRTPLFTRIIRLASAQHYNDSLIATLKLINVFNITRYKVLLHIRC